MALNCEREIPGVVFLRRINGFPWWGWQQPAGHSIAIIRRLELQFLAFSGVHHVTGGSAAPCNMILTYVSGRLPAVNLNACIISPISMCHEATDRDVRFKFFIFYTIEAG
jgi:hypothetical protein